jgi:hypothetical protein
LHREINRLTTLWSPRCRHRARDRSIVGDGSPFSKATEVGYQAIPFANLASVGAACRHHVHDIAPTLSIAKVYFVFSLKEFDAGHF